MAIVYQDDEWGKDGRAGMEIGAKKYGKEVVAAVSFKRGSKDMTSQVTTLIRSGATHVYYVGFGPDFAMLIRTAQSLNYKPQFIGDYVSVDHRLGEWGGAATDGAWAIGVTGLPSDDGWGIEEAKAVLGRYMPPPDNQFQFPTQALIYAGAKLAEAGLKKCGRDLTRERFVEALEETVGMDMGGLVGKIGFSKTSRKGISEYRIYRFHYDSAVWSILSDWRKPSVEAR